MSITKTLLLSISSLVALSFAPTWFRSSAAADELPGPVTIRGQYWESAADDANDFSFFSDHGYTQVLLSLDLPDFDPNDYDGGFDLSVGKLLLVSPALPAHCKIVDRSLNLGDELKESYLAMRIGFRGAGCAELAHSFYAHPLKLRFEKVSTLNHFKKVRVLEIESSDLPTQGGPQS